MIGVCAAGGVVTGSLGSTGGAGRVLVLEDDEGISELWSLLLQQDGFQVVCRESALGLGALLRRWRPDVILLDLGLPYRSGAAVLADFKADPTTAMIPIVVLTGAPESLTGERRALAAAVLTKPVGMQRLLATVRTAQASADDALRATPERRAAA